MTTGYFIPPYRKFAPPVDESTVCELDGYHHGDATTKDDAHGRWNHWSCCGEREFVGELADCDTCLEPGLIPDGGGLPEGWIEDTNGAHCPKCYPKEWLT